MVTRLQEENRRLSEALQESRSDSQYSSKQSTNNLFSTNTILEISYYINLFIIHQLNNYILIINISINIFLAFTASQEVDIAVLQHLRSMIDKQRDQIRGRDKELLQKNSEIENVNWYL